jgi:hypothetical protein
VEFPIWSSKWGHAPQSWLGDCHPKEEAAEGTDAQRTSQATARRFAVSRVSMRVSTYAHVPTEGSHG